jgi:hypothetical protein
MARKKKRAEEAQQQQQRPISLDTLKYFWDLMAHYFPELRINLCLFNYKAKGNNDPLVRHNVREDVPVAQAYEAVLEFLDDYHKGEDILWKPSPSLTETSMLWVDDFRLKNELGLKPIFYIQTSKNKHQAFFKLKETVPIKEAEELQKILARLVGDKAAGSYVQPRRMAGLANGKYEDDPLVIMLKDEEGDGVLSPNDLRLIAQYNLKPVGAGGGVAETNNGVAEDVAQETQGQRQEPKAKRVGGRYIKPVVPANYKPVLIKDRSAFIKRRPDGTIDDSATDMGWATSIARMTYEAGWDDGAIVLTIYEILGNESPELRRRKRTPKHARQYLYMTVWKALRKVKESDETDPRIAFGK